MTTVLNLSLYNFNPRDVMKNHDLLSDSITNNYPLKKLAEKLVTNLEGVNHAMKSLGWESNGNARLGVNIDWSKGTIILESNRR